MNTAKIMKLINTETCENAITFVYLHNRYYFRFHFNDNQGYIPVRVDKLIVALKSEKTATTPFGFGGHGEDKYLWVQANEKSLTIHIANETGGLKGGEPFYTFEFEKNLSLKELKELVQLFLEMEKEQKKFYLLDGAESLLK